MRTRPRSRPRSRRWTATRRRRRCGKADGPLRANYAAVDKIYALGASEVGYGRAADQLGTEARRVAGAATGLLDAASREYDRRASRAQLQATVGSIALILLLLFAFGLAVPARGASPRPGRAPRRARTRSCWPSAARRRCTTR